MLTVHKKSKNKSNIEIYPFHERNASIPNQKYISSKICAKIDFLLALSNIQESVIFEMKMKQSGYIAT